MKILFTPTGRLQFLAALAYRKADNPADAQNFNEIAEGIHRRLEDFPESGRPLPEFPDLPFREVVIQPYRFFYRMENDTVWIVAAWHSTQNP